MAQILVKDQLVVKVDTTAVTEALSLVKELAEDVEALEAKLRRLGAIDIRPDVDLAQGKKA